MKIFKNTTTGYSPLIPNLEGYWDQPFDNLPEILKPLVKRGFFTCPWDNLDAENRRRIAAQYDYLHDPNQEPVIIYLLILLVHQLEADEAKARNELNDTKALIIGDTIKAINHIIDTDREPVGAEIQRLKASSLARPKKEDVSETERDSVLKILLGMAVSKYDYDPSANRNSATGDKAGSISADLAKLGLDVCSDTIRSYMNEAEKEFGDLVSTPEAN